MSDLGPSTPQRPSQVFLTRAEPGGWLERFLLGSRYGSLSGPRLRSMDPARMSSRALDWALSCQEAQRRFEACPGRPEQRPIPLIIPGASVQALRAHRWRAGALKAASALLAPPLGAARLAARLAPAHLKPLARALSVEPARRAIHERLQALSLGPHASFQGFQGIEPQASPPPISDALCSGPNRAQARLPGQSQSDAGFHRRLLADRGWSRHEIRVFTALHEAAHATHAMQSPDFERLFGLHHAGAARSAFVRLLWAPADSPEARLAPWRDGDPPSSSPTHPRLAEFSPFEAVCKYVFLEGYADCFASLAFAEGDAAKAAACARDWIDLRAQRVPNDAPRFERFAGSDLKHDSREALRELVALCEASGPEGPIPPEGGLHELALRCALRGAARWMCLAATLPEGGPIADALWSKLEALGEWRQSAGQADASEARFELAKPEADFLSLALERLRAPRSERFASGHEPFAPALLARRARRLRLAEARPSLSALLAEFGAPRGPLEGWMFPKAERLSALERFSEWARQAARALSPATPSSLGPEPSLAPAEAGGEARQGASMKGPSRKRRF